MLSTGLYPGYLQARLRQFKVHFGAHRQKTSFRALCYILRNLHPSFAEALCYGITLLFPAKAEFYAYRVFFLWSRNAEARFINTCRKAIRQHPDYWYLRWILALDLRRRNSVGEAISVLGSPCPDDESFALLRLRALLNRQHGDIEQARELAEFARGKFRGRVWPSEFLVELLLSEGRFRQANAMAEQACSEFPDNVKLHYLAGFSAHRLTLWDKARSHFSLALGQYSYPVHVMELFLQSLSYKKEISPHELSIINAYTRWALDHRANLSVMLRIASLMNEPPDIRALRFLANSSLSHDKSGFDKRLYD